MMQTGPRLVGHPFTTLERELKRLVLREQLQQDQHQIVQQDGLSEREVKDKILKLYELYETFKNVDNSCLSDTETKFNLYQVYQNVFKTKVILQMFININIFNFRTFLSFLLRI